MRRLVIKVLDYLYINSHISAHTYARWVLAVWNWRKA